MFVGLLFLTFLVAFSQVRAIDDKPWPIIGRRDESFESLSLEELKKTLGFSQTLKE
jgi:hypothetical protein